MMSILVNVQKLVGGGILSATFGRNNNEKTKEKFTHAIVVTLKDRDGMDLNFLKIVNRF